MLPITIHFFLEYKRDNKAIEEIDICAACRQLSFHLSLELTWIEPWKPLAEANPLSVCVISQHSFE